MKIEPKPQSEQPPEPRPRVTPLEGDTTIDDQVSFEVAALSHVAISKLASEIAIRVEAKLRAPGGTGGPEAAGPMPARIIFLNERLAQALEYHQSFSVQLAMLEGSFEGAKKAAEAGRRALKHKRPKIALAAGVPAMLTAAAGAVSTAVDLLALFREDVTYSGREVEISEPALVAELARCLSEVEGVTFFWPGLGLSIQTREDSPEAPEFLEGVHRSMGKRNEARRAIHLLAVEVAELPDKSPRLPPARFALDQAHELFGSADSVLRQLATSLGKVDEEAGVSPLQLLYRANEIRAQVTAAPKDVYFLYARVEKAGGSYRIRKNLFRTLFFRDGLSFSGGSIVTFALLQPDGEFLDSGNLRHRGAFVYFEKRNTDFSQLAPFALKSLSKLRAVFRRKQSGDRLQPPE